jgi:hypothetical protein
VKFFSARGLENDRVFLRGFAMAAVALGVPLRPLPFVDRTSAAAGGGKRRELTWLLEPETADGKVETQTLWEQWNSQEWQAEHPDHQLTILRAFWDSLQEAERREPDYAELQFNKGKRFVTVPASWPVERIREAIKSL